jgi:hypothetical protein
VNAPFRFAVVAVAALLISLTPSIVLAAPAVQLEVRWSQLQPVIEGRQISIRLTDGVTVEGKHSSPQADALSMQVTKTSDATKHPMGATNLPRSELAQLTLKRHCGWKGRTIGLITGGAIAAVAAGILHAEAKNEVGGWSSASAGVAAAGGAGAIGIGYLIGWLRDSAGSRPEQVVRILPDAASR